MGKRRIDFAPTNWGRQTVGMAMYQEELLESQYTQSSEI